MKKFLFLKKMLKRKKMHAVLEINPTEQRLTVQCLAVVCVILGSWEMNDQIQSLLF